MVLDSYINNTTTTQLSSLIGGFVAINGASGKIMLSSIDGKTVMTSSNDSNNNLFRKTNSSVNGSFNVGGFVNENSGSISDCFSNIKIISQNRSSGFVFTNKGAITNCYTASYITENHTDHTPFTGTATGGSILNTGTITNCYYLSGNLGGITNEIATPLTVTDDKVLTSQFNMFVFNTGSDYDGDWSLDTSLTGQLPLLTDANLIVSGYTWILNPNDPVNVSPEQVITYNWIYDSDNGSGIGTLTNPYVISSAEDWNQSFATFNTSYFRLVSNIVFTSTVQPNTTSVVFKGELFGSGFTVSGLSLVAENSTATSFGLFAQINQRTVGEQNTRGLVKDLTLTVDNVYANDITSVGALAGIISDSYVNHITISGADTVVQGRHFVGGLAGRIHNSSVKAISSNISINASYRGDETLGTLYNALTEANYIAYNYSYAGAVAGIVTGTSVVKGVSVTGNSRVIAYYAGTAFGLIGTGSSVSQVSVTVELTQFIRAYFVAGGVVAENRGTLSSAYISHTDSIQNNIDYNNPSTNRNLTFFAGTPKVVGGLVGFNNAGTITNSYSKIDVRSTTDKIIVLGGLVGVTAGGTVQTSFATGSVLGGTSNVNYVLGGLIGAVTNKTALKAALFSEITGYDTITNSPQTTLTNVVAFNNWLSADYAVIKLAVSKGIVVGCINSSTPDTAISASGSYMQYLSSAPDTFNSNWATGVGNRGNNLNGTDSYPYSGTAVANYYYPSGSFVLTWDKVRNKNGNYKSIFNPFSDNVFDKTLSSSYFPKLKLNINL